MPEQTKIGLKQELRRCEIRPRASLVLPLRTLIIMHERSQLGFNATPSTSCKFGTNGGNKCNFNGDFHCDVALLQIHQKPLQTNMMG